MLKSRIPAVITRLSVVVDAALVAGAELVAADAEMRLEPHRFSGELQAEVHVDKSRPEGIYVIAGGDGAFYGHMLEHGTSHSPPYPFLVPALEAKRGEIVGLASAAMKGL